MVKLQIFLSQHLSLWSRNLDIPLLHLLLSVVTIQSSFLHIIPLQEIEIRIVLLKPLTFVIFDSQCLDIQPSDSLSLHEAEIQIFLPLFYPFPHVVNHFSVIWNLDLPSLALRLYIKLKSGSLLPSRLSMIQKSGSSFYHLLSYR